MLKGEVDRMPQLMAEQAYWISEELWRLTDRQAALQRTARARERVTRQARRDLQKMLQADRQRRVQQAGVEVEELKVYGQVR